MSGTPERLVQPLRIVPLRRLPGLRVSGEIDRRTRRPWESALEELVAAGRDMHLELSDLTFIDVRGTWLLAEAAHNLPLGKKVVLHHPPYCLRSVLALIGSFPSPIEVET
ncbi:STAS domain-containing protein [Streptosporangium sp. NPDC051022]|uniref:STAS domain-containing protein n=1 Tax=Streptosporangium sp. NPDC051022 TaxID=3155752 RepID=UPI00342D29E4